MSALFQRIIVEGYLDAEAAMVLLAKAGFIVDSLSPIIAGNVTNFWAKAPAFNNLAKKTGQLFFGLVDQENREDCAPAQIERHLTRGKTDTFVLRIAERMLESWLLADETNLARFLGVSVELLRKNKRKAVQTAPEIHPKTVISNLARNSRRREIREDLAPEEGSKGLVGKGYTMQIRKFILNHWDPNQAREKNTSLHHALRALEGVELI